MDKATGEYKKLLFKYAVLSARMEIREFFLTYAVKDVYENIGQVLSLVRMQLASLHTQELIENGRIIVQSGNLVAQSIRDLRSMCRSFYPDNDLLKEHGFKEGIELTLKVLELSNKPAIKIKGDHGSMPDQLKFIAFKILLKVLISIAEIGGTYKNLAISYTEENFTLNAQYNGKMINWRKKNIDSKPGDGLTIQALVEIAEGQINTKQSKGGINSIIFKLPLNISYE